MVASAYRAQVSKRSRNLDNDNDNRRGEDLDLHTVEVKDIAKHLHRVPLTEYQKHPSSYEVRAGMSAEDGERKGGRYLFGNFRSRLVRSEELFQRGMGEKHASSRGDREESEPAAVGQDRAEAGGRRGAQVVRVRMTEPMVSGACEQALNAGGRKSS